MKKNILLLSAGCLLTLASCGGETTSSQPSSTQTPTSESQSSLPVGSVDSDNEAIKALSSALSSIDMSEMAVYAGLYGKLSVETTSYHYVSTAEEDTTVLSKSGYSFDHSTSAPGLRSTPPSPGSTKRIPPLSRGRPASPASSNSPPSPGKPSTIRHRTVRSRRPHGRRSRTPSIAATSTRPPI